MGRRAYRDQVIQYDATVVERLRDAGAVLVAKLSMGALAQGARWFAGVTRNPWVPDETNKTQAVFSWTGVSNRSRSGWLFDRYRDFRID